MKYNIIINDKEYSVEVEKGKANINHVATVRSQTAPAVEQVESKVEVAAGAKSAMVQKPTSQTPTVSDGDTSFKAPMPGTVIDLKVKVGNNVKKGDVLLIVEAMKMENDITSNVSGTVKEILVSKGQSVDMGETLLIIG